MSVRFVLNKRHQRRSGLKNGMYRPKTTGRGLMFPCQRKSCCCMPIRNLRPRLTGTAL
ncbi:hypothetical protein KCP78_16935 [Salmonella enterica subsp. enterica]|nr:hypothetical protein KCP78_16935 [Salmonella enterica subsp. enterica]